jgi:hypothetical protein
MISGTVVDARGTPVDGVEVTMPRTRFQGALTAHGGRFLLTRVPVGDHTVRVATASGDTVMQTVTTRSGRVARLEFRIRD